MAWVSQGEADSYHEVRQGHAVWAAVPAADRRKAIENASSRLEAFSFRGEDLNRVAPRFAIADPADPADPGVADMPYRLKIATFELAYYYAVQGLPYGGMHAGIGDIPVIVKDLLAPYVGEPRGLRPVGSKIGYE